MQLPQKKKLAIILASILALVLVIGGFLYFFQIDFKIRNNAPSLSKLNKKIQQTVVPSASAAEIHTECEAKPQPSEKFDCYHNGLETYMKGNGGRKTLELLQAVSDLGGYAQVNCHPLSHEVGHIALHFYGNIPAAAPEYIPTCSSGYYHGLLEEYLANVPSYDQGIVDACGDPNKEIFFNWFQCTHGEGHGVMQFRDDEVPLALKDCDLLPDIKQAREICYGGVFMENITTDEKTGHASKYIKKEDPLYPCNAPEIADKYRGSCYFLASSQILKINGYNFKDAFVQCDKAEQQYKWLCFQSLGRDVSGTALGDIHKVIEMCQYGQPVNNGDCFFGAERNFVNEKGEFDVGIALCEAAPEQYKNKCFSAVYLDLSLYKKGQDFIDVCNKISEPYKTDCKFRAI